MADKLTPKQEAFALSYIETGNASEAYRRSYNVGADTKPETVWKRACELLADGKVSGRVAQLQMEASDRHAVTIDSLTRELDEARKMAIKLEQSTAMTQATMGKAKLHGKLVEKIDGSFTVNLPSHASQL